MTGGAGFYPGNDIGSTGPGAGNGGSNGSGSSGSNGAGGNPGDGVVGTAQALFTCDPGQVPESTAWRRLNRRQYELTLHELLSELVSGADLDAVEAAVEGPLAAMPEEGRFALPQDLHGSYRRLNQAVDQNLVEAWYAVASAAAEALTEDGRLAKVFGDCATDGSADNDVACVDDLLDTWGASVLRRPLDADTREFYRGFFGAELGNETLTEGFSDVLAGLLNAPQMLYLVEHGEADESGDGMLHLDGYELASRLSYHFWGTGPDAELMAAAEAGELHTESGYQKQVDRLFDDPRTRATLREFYRDWLKLEDLPELDQHVDNAQFLAFAGADVPTGHLRENAIDEVLDLLDYYTWEEEGGLDDVLTTPFSFAKTQDVADLYGIETWSGEGKPPQFADGERPGFLSRLAMVATGTVNTRPIMKGVFIRRTILCDDIPPPPENANAKTPESDGLRSTRQVVEDLTEQPGSACAGCHSTMINGLGFATEGYDSLGRLRDTQVLFDEDGFEMGEASVNTLSTPRVLPGDDTEADGAEDLASLIADSGKAHACIARNYFRFSFGRWENSARDGCALEELRSALVEGGSLREMMRTVALTDSFKQRSFQEEAK